MEFNEKNCNIEFLKSFETIKVKTDLLDNYCEEKIEKIDILKIDVEGSEIEVLEGSKKMLKNIKIIQIEIFDTKKLHSQKFEKIKKYYLMKVLF